MLSVRGPGGSAQIVSYRSTTEELLSIQELAQRGRTAPDAVLARTNAQLDLLEEALTGKVPYVRREDDSIWQTLAASLLYDLVCAIVDEPSTAGGAMIQALVHMSYIPPSGAHTCTGLHPRDLLASLELSAARDTTIRTWDHLVGLHACGNHDAMITGLCQWVASVLPENRNLIASLRKCLLNRAPLPLKKRFFLTQRDDTNKEVLQVMTLHGSKGLEFGRVHICGLTDNVVPGTKSRVDEERCLLYVGMTRAKEHLTLSYSRHDGAVSLKKSRLLKDTGLKIKLA